MIDYPMVSIVIPTYNGSHTIMSSVLSAVGQTICSKEVIVVDDNGVGTEEQIKTEMILKNLIEKCEVRYICHECNKNGSAARNTGLQEARGKFVTFLDDDDVLFPRKIEIQIHEMNRNGYNDLAMCVCEGLYVSSDGRGFVGKVDNMKSFMYYYLLDKNYFNTTAILFNTQLLRDENGFDESFKRHQDWELCVRLLSKYNVCLVHKPLMIRYAERRNDPKTFNNRIDDLDYFIRQRTDSFEKTMTPKQIKKAIKYKKRRICQSMIRKLRIKEAYDYSKTYAKSAEMFLVMISMVNSLLLKVLFKNRIIAHPKKTPVNEQL